MKPEIRCYEELRAVLGEGPAWDETRGRLTFIDAAEKVFFTLDPATGASERTELPQHPGSYAWRRNGGMVMAYRTEIALTDGGLADARAVPTPGLDFTEQRFNDGGCDRAGRFFVGTMHRKLKDPVGNLFRLDPDLTLTHLVSDLVCSNGVAFSPDDRVMYHTDTGQGRIFACDYDIDTGAISNRRVFADFTTGKGRPDGCTIDAEGCVWTAAITGSEIVRLDPAGRRVGAIELPVARPTSVMFGGSDLKTLFITSMRVGLTPEELAAQPQAGCLFSVRVDVAGLPEPRFAG
jgi:sugar lactone lactonase YvrE